MIPYSRDTQKTIPTSSVKIIGLGGAGANMLERIALDGMEGSEMLALNTDLRTLSGSFAKAKIQLGINLTKGLGTGGDPELGHQAVLEAEKEVRAAIKNHKIVFLCVGLGGGTGSPRRRSAIAMPPRSSGRGSPTPGSATPPRSRSRAGSARRRSPVCPGCSA